MRHNIAIYAAAVLMMATACEKQMAEVIYPEPDYANIALSSKSYVAEREGGRKEIFVESNRETIEVICTADWLDISIEDRALTLFISRNDEQSSREAVIDIVTGSKPDVAKARFRLLQLGSEATDLSSMATANCYIATTESTFAIRADVKGNGKRDGNSRYMATHDAKIYGASYADLIWEATFDGDKTRSCDIIEGMPHYSPNEEKIYFSTGAVEGNALIAIKSAEGEILWSWHIWVSNEPIATSTHNGIEWMTRNLGALNNEPTDIANRGMLYQWGRKEPFLPSPAEYIEIPTHSYDEDYNLSESEEEYYAIQEAIEAARIKVNINNTQSGNGSMGWQYVGLEAPVALNSPGNIEYALRHPTTILACRSDIAIGEYVFDWYMQQDLMNSAGVMMQSNSMLWGDAAKGTEYKTIFDPCPAGYCVPPRGAFGEIPADYACSYVSEEWQREPYGWRWSGGNGDYFPSTGNLDVSGLIGETSEKMLYWTAESFGNGGAGFGKAATLFVAFNDIYYGIYPLLDATVAGSWYSYGARAYAAPVRCVRETNEN